jgi:hypothetical protein
MSAPIPYVNWPTVHAMVGNDIPYSELPTDPAVFHREIGAHLHTNAMSAFQLCTAGAIRFIERHRGMKKEAEFKSVIKRLTSQQKKGNAKYEQLLIQYEQLLESYNAMKQAYETETETTRALKEQLDEILEMINGEEGMS